MAKFTNLPDRGQVWVVGGKHYYAVKAPKGGGWITWKFRNKSALKSAFEGGKVKVNRRMSRNKYKGLGALNWGYTDEIQNTENPFSQFVQNWKKEAQINPMLKDPEVVAVYAQAVMEGRAPTRAELETTDWWRSRSAEERAWVQLASADPKTARSVKARNRAETRDALVAAGFQGNPWGVSGKIADRFTRGQLNKQQLQREIEKLTDPFADGANKFANRYLPDEARIVKHKKTGKTYARYKNRDYELSTADARLAFGVNNPEIVNGVRRAGAVSEIVGNAFDELSALGGVDEVRDKVEEWLGPKFAAGWDNRAIEKWAHDIRDNESMADKLEEELRRQRSAVLPGYDENLSYEQIAQPWRSVVLDTWGEQMEETDPLFYQILKANDVEVAGKLLRKEGIKRGKTKVQADAARSLTQAFGGQVTGVMGRG